MALAPFFDKTALAASAVLTQFEHRKFAATLTAHRVAVAFDADAIASREGRITLRLTVNLLARLFPWLTFHAADDAALEFGDLLASEAQRINPSISIVRQVPRESVTDPENSLSACLCVGTFRDPSRPAPVAAHRWFLGSDGWDAVVSDSVAVGSAHSPFPFGAMASACLGAANVFRSVFSAQLSSPGADHELVLCTRTLTRSAQSVAEWMSRGAQRSADTPVASLADRIDLGSLTLVGVGAVGGAFLYALRHVDNATGAIAIVDPEAVDATNPQRYVLTAWSDVGRGKVAVAQRFWSADAKVASYRADVAPDGIRPDPDSRSAVRILEHPVSWGAFAAAASRPWRFDRVAVAVDSARDRIAVQAAMPRWIANAWTQPGDLGISRHETGSGAACLACLYVPLGAASRHEDEIVAEALRVPDSRMRVRELLATQQPTPPDFLSAIAVANGLHADALNQFLGQPLRAFYHEAICGGIVLRMQAHASDAAILATSAGEPTRGLHQVGSDVRDASEELPEVASKIVDRSATVPMAFQSVLAGVLLAAQTTADALDLSALPLGQKGVIDTLRPLSPHLHVPVAPHPSGHCLCQDADFQHAYDAAWRGDPHITAPASPLELSTSSAT